MSIRSAVTGKQVRSLALTEAGAHCATRLPYPIPPTMSMIRGLSITGQTSLDTRQGQVQSLRQARGFVDGRRQLLDGFFCKWAAGPRRTIDAG
jgi:hypothetical protein